MKNNNLLIITPQRSGSTWLFDALTVHPGMRIAKKADLYKYLDFPNRRRYPRDLSNKNGCDLKIEVVAGTMELIPNLKDADLEKKYARLFKKSIYYLEKIHPDFYGYKNSNLQEKILALRNRGHVLKVLYHVRHPKDTIVSFLNYQRRGNWYTHMNLMQVFEHLRNVYQSMNGMSTAIPGLVTDYSQLRLNTASVLKNISNYIWEDDILTNAIAEDYFNSVSRKTNREARKMQSKNFLDNEEGRNSIISGDELNTILTENHLLYEECLWEYQQLVAMVPAR